MTRIDEEVFSLELPGEWERVASSEPGSLLYRETGGLATVTVMLLRVKPVFAIADRARLLGDYVHHRSSYELGQSPSLENLPPVSRVVGGMFEATWDASDAVAGRLRRHRAMLAADVLIDVCYDAAAPDAAIFDEQAASVLNSVVISLEEAR